MKNIVPKWEREVRSFIGIKQGIILEGNVYDEYPIFEYLLHEDQPELLDMETLDQTILSLVSQEDTDVVFFDPVLGFYSCEEDIEQQRQVLSRLFEGYGANETIENYGCTVCMMPSSSQGHRRGNVDTDKYIWMSEIIRRSMDSQDNRNIVFVMKFASRLDSCNLREAEANQMFMNLMAATTDVQSSKINCNSLLFVVDKYNDIPAWLYLNNPNVRTVSIALPDRMTRKLYLESLCGKLMGYQTLSEEDNESGKRFIAETEGLQLKEMHQILQLAYRKAIPPKDINKAFREYKYGVSDNPWENLENDILTHIEDNLQKRVKGQEEAVKKVKTVVTRAVKGLSGLQHSSNSHKPKGILFFAGPTGVGKTETAKALAEAVFGDENAYIRFDMSEYRMEQSDQKLFGAPPGYVGYDGGGQLTNAVKNRPFSVLLFDEIEKASPTILDKFLQILEDGRMTDNQGNTVYFGETIIIFTSNIGTTKDDDKDPGSWFSATSSHKIPTISIDDPEQEDTEEFRNRVTETLTQGVKDYFYDNGRPELLNRLGENNIVVFQFINKKDAEIICDYKLDKICEAIQEDKKIHIDTCQIRDFLRRKAVKVRANGGRGICNMLEDEFSNALADALCVLPETVTELTAVISDGGIRFDGVRR